MLLSKNVGTVDRIARIVLGAVMIALPYIYASAMWDNGLLRWGVPAVGLVLFVTALANFCPLYRLLGINTCRMK